MRMRMFTTMLAVAVVAAALVLAGPTPASAQGGTISGEVKLSGAAPAPKVVKVNKDNEVCGAEKKIVDVAAGAGGGLADAVVVVSDAKGAKAAKKAVLDQKGCEFRPSLLVMAPGEVDILNSDGVLHNIHTFSTANPSINKAQPKFKKTMTEKFEKPEVIKVTCDVHSWMLGWVAVTPGVAAVTDKDGVAKLENVPAGKQKIEVWHETLGKQEKEVDVKPGATTKVSFEMKGK